MPPPNDYSNDMFLPRVSRFTGVAPRAAGPDQVRQLFPPKGERDMSRYHMVYTYLPLHGAERSRGEYTDGVIFRPETTSGIEKSRSCWFPLPPVRPPREALICSKMTPTATMPPPLPQPSTSCASAPVPHATHCRYSEGQNRTAVAPLLDENRTKIVVSDAKLFQPLTLATDALIDACSPFIQPDNLLQKWASDNVHVLYKSVITPMSTILNRFKKGAQDVVEFLYKLQVSVWTNSETEAHHKRMTVDFLTGNDSLNFIFGDKVRLENGQEVHFAFEHDAIIEIVERVVFRDANYKCLVNSDGKLDNIFAISGAAACCSLQEFTQGSFKKIDFTYPDFHALYERLMAFIQDKIRKSPMLLVSTCYLIDDNIKRGISPASLVIFVGMRCEIYFHQSELAIPQVVSVRKHAETTFSSNECPVTVPNLFGSQILHTGPGLQSPAFNCATNYNVLSQGTDLRDCSQGFFMKRVHVCTCLSHSPPLNLDCTKLHSSVTFAALILQRLKLHSHESLLARSNVDTTRFGKVTQTWTIQDVRQMELRQFPDLQYRKMNFG
ncbi:hypothetical protein DFH29DRAFT_874015 [Suillus ampliporus]|nr:hypothetical protein DFH29DRAFT_874015 [Suillus ampliporus]